MQQEEVGILNVRGVESDDFLKIEQRMAGGCGRHYSLYRVGYAALDVPTLARPHRTPARRYGHQRHCRGSGQRITLLYPGPSLLQPASAQAVYSMRRTLMSTTARRLSNPPAKKET